MAKTAHTQPLQEDVWSCMEDYLINTYDELHSAQYNHKQSEKTNNNNNYNNDKQCSNASSKVHMRSKMDWYAFVYDVCHGDPLRTRELYIRVALTILHALQGCVLFPLLRQISKEMPIEVMTDKNKSYQLGLNKHNKNKPQRQLSREEINTRSVSTQSFSQMSTPEKDNIANALTSTQISSSMLLHKKEEEEQEETPEEGLELSSSWSNPSSSTNSFSFSLFHRSRVRNKESFSFMRRIWGKHKIEESDQDEYNRQHETTNNNNTSSTNSKCNSADVVVIKDHITHKDISNNNNKTSANNNNVQRKLFTSPHNPNVNIDDKCSSEPVQRVRRRQQVKQWISQKLHNTANHFLNHITLSSPEETATEIKRKKRSIQHKDQSQLTSTEHGKHEPQHSHKRKEEEATHENTNICSCRADKEKYTQMPKCQVKNTELPKNVDRCSNDEFAFRSSDRECANELLPESNRKEVIIKPQTSSTINLSASTSSLPLSSTTSSSLPQSKTIDQKSLPSQQQQEIVSTQRESSIVFSPLEPSRNTSELLDLSSTIYTEEVTRTNSTNSYSFQHYTNWQSCISRGHNACYDRLLDVFMNECDVFSNFTIVVKSSFGYLDQYFTKRVGIDTIEILCVKLYYKVVYLPLQQLLTQSLLYNVECIRNQRWCDKQIDKNLRNRIELVNDYINFVTELLASVTEHSSFMIHEDLEEQELEEEELENLQEELNDELYRAAYSKNNSMQSAKQENLLGTDSSNSRENANVQNNAECTSEENHNRNSCGWNDKDHMEEYSPMTILNKNVVKRKSNSPTQTGNPTIINLQGITQLRNKLETGSLAQHLSSAELYKRAKLQEKHEQQQQQLRLLLSSSSSWEEENKEVMEVYTSRSITASIILNVKTPLPVLLSKQLGARYITQLREFYNYMAKIRLMRHDASGDSRNGSTFSGSNNNRSVMSYVSWVYQVMSMEMHLLPNLENESFLSSSSSFAPVCEHHNETMNALPSETNMQEYNVSNQSDHTSASNCADNLTKTPLESVTCEFVHNVRDALVETLVHNVHRRIILDKQSGFAQLLEQWEQVYMKCTLEHSQEYNYNDNYNMHFTQGWNLHNSSSSSCTIKFSDTDCKATSDRFAACTYNANCHDYQNKSIFDNTSQHLQDVLQAAVNAIKRFVTIFTLSSNNDENDVNDNGILLLSSILATHVISRGAAIIEEYLEQCSLRKEEEHNKECTNVKEHCKETQSCNQEMQNSVEIEEQYKLISRLLALYKMHDYLIDMCFANKGKHFTSDNSIFMNVNSTPESNKNNINMKPEEQQQEEQEVEYSSVLMRSALNDAFKAIVNPHYWDNVETFLALQLQRINDEGNYANNNTQGRQSARKRNKKKNYKHVNHLYESTNNINLNKENVPSVLLHRDAGVKALSPLMHLAENTKCVEVNFSTMCNKFVATYIQERTNCFTHHYYAMHKEEEKNDKINNAFVINEGWTLYSVACIVALLEDENEFVTQYSYSLTQRLLLLHDHSSSMQSFNYFRSHSNECNSCCCSNSDKMKLDRSNENNQQQEIILVELLLENMFVNALQLVLPASSLFIHRLQEMIHDIHKSLEVNFTFEQSYNQRQHPQTFDNRNNNVVSYENSDGDEEDKNKTIHFNTHVLNSAHWLTFTPQFIHTTPSNLTLHKFLHDTEIAFVEHYKKLHPSRLLKWHHLDSNNINANNVKLQIVISEEVESDDDDVDYESNNNKAVSYTITTNVIQATILLHLQDALVKSYNVRQTHNYDELHTLKQREHVEEEEEQYNSVIKERSEWLTGEELSEQLHMSFDELRPFLLNLLMPLGSPSNTENTQNNLSSRLVLRMSNHERIDRVTNLQQDTTNENLLHSLQSDDCFALNCNFTSSCKLLCIPSNNFINDVSFNNTTFDNNNNISFTNRKSNTSTCLQFSPSESSLLTNGASVNNKTNENTESLTGPKFNLTLFPRKTLIEMQVMHEFKQHHKLTLVELYVKVKDQLALHFIPTVREVKEQLEKLVEREYIQRSSTHHNVFKYVP